VSITNNQGLKRTKEDQENDRLVKEYFEQGGTITQCKSNTTTPDIEYSFGWGKRKPQAKSKD
jgi:hypothetical protein